MTGPRWAALALLVTAGVGLWQAGRLDRWSIDGPGPGLFPTGVAVLFGLLALVVLLRPGSVPAADEDRVESDDGTAARGDDARFRLYALSMGVLALGSAFAGYAITALAVSVLIIRFAERRSWRAALVYGLVCAAVGLVGFGWLLRVDLPTRAIDRAVLSLLR